MEFCWWNWLQQTPYAEAFALCANGKFDSNIFFYICFIWWIKTLISLLNDVILQFSFKILSLLKQILIRLLHNLWFIFFTNFFSFVFQIYQDFPNLTINNGLIVDETSTLTAVCALWGNWDPPQLPLCIRKIFIIHFYVTLFGLFFTPSTMCHLVTLALTIPPPHCDMTILFSKN